MIDLLISLGSEIGYITTEDMEMMPSTSGMLFLNWKLVKELNKRGYSFEEILENDELSMYFDYFENAIDEEEDLEQAIDTMRQLLDLDEKPENIKFIEESGLSDKTRQLLIGDNEHLTRGYNTGLMDAKIKSKE